MSMDKFMFSNVGAFSFSTLSESDPQQVAIDKLNKRYLLINDGKGIQKVVQSLFSSSIYCIQCSHYLFLLSKK